MRLAVALAACLVLARPAGAATVTAVFAPGDYRPTLDQTLVRFEAAPGEVNQLTVRTSGPPASAEVRLRDIVTVSAGEGCEQISDREARCPLRPYSGASVTAALGDGDDRAVASGYGIGLYGGPGADELVGGTWSDTLDGGPGADVVRGLGGGDEIMVSEGGTGEAVEHLSGGGGRDTVTFGRAAVADLAAGRVRLGAGTATLAGFERFVGSAHGDRISGGGGNDRIYGADGDDVLDGRGGDDMVTGGSGRDEVRGGRGDDRLELRQEAYPEEDDDTGANAFDCGPGADSIETIDDLDAVGTSCERFAGFRVLADLRRSAPAHLALAPPRCSIDRACREVLRLDAVAGGDRSPRARTRLATARYHEKPGGRARRVRLDRQDRALLRRERARQVLVRLGYPGPAAHTRFLLRLDR